MLLKCSCFSFTHQSSQSTKLQQVPGDKSPLNDIKKHNAHAVNLKAASPCRSTVCLHFLEATLRVLQGLVEAIKFGFVGTKCCLGHFAAQMCNVLPHLLHRPIDVLLSFVERLANRNVYQQCCQLCLFTVGIAQLHRSETCFFFGRGEARCRKKAVSHGAPVEVKRATSLFSESITCK